MSNKYIYLISIIILSMVMLCGCSNNDNLDMLDLITPPEASKDIETPSDIIDINWIETEHETFNDITDVTMAIDEESISPTGLTTIFENVSNKQIVYGDKYDIEIKKNDTWYQVPKLRDNYCYNNINHELPYKQSKKWKTNWEWVYGQFPQGEYRIIKDIANYSGSAKFAKDYMAAEFVIK